MFQIKFNDHTPEECKEKWKIIEKKVRGFRILKEMVGDAKLWVEKPWANFYSSQKQVLSKFFYSLHYFGSEILYLNSGQNINKKKIFVVYFFFLLYSIVSSFHYSLNCSAEPDGPSDYCNSSWQWLNYKLLRHEKAQCFTPFKYYITTEHYHKRVCIKYSWQFNFISAL